MDEKEKKHLEQVVDEEDFYALEEEDWFQEDTEMWIWGPIEIQDQDGKTIKIVCADDEGNIIKYKENKE